jgi:hypothetical protein
MRDLIMKTIVQVPLVYVIPVDYILGMLSLVQNSQNSRLI